MSMPDFEQQGPDNLLLGQPDGKSTQESATRPALRANAECVGRGAGLLDFNLDVLPLTSLWPSTATTRPGLAQHDPGRCGQLARPEAARRRHQSRRDRCLDRQLIRSGDGRDASRDHGRRRPRQRPGDVDPFRVSDEMVDATVKVTWPDGTSWSEVTAGQGRQWFCVLSAPGKASAGEEKLKQPLVDAAGPVWAQSRNAFRSLTIVASDACNIALGKPRPSSKLASCATTQIGVARELSDYYCLRLGLSRPADISHAP